MHRDNLIYGHEICVHGGHNGRATEISGYTNNVYNPGVSVDVYVLPLAAVLLNSLAFSRAAKPVFIGKSKDEHTHANSTHCF